MKIGIIQASSQADKNNLLDYAVRKYAPDLKVINFGCKEGDIQSYSYIEISLLIGLLLSSEAVNFIVTGCSSGQGMMLACNSMPGVICGYAPSPMDAYLFAQINNGNAISLPLGEDYTWGGYGNFERTIAKLFSEPFGQGYPASESDRKIKDTMLLKRIRSSSQVKMIDFIKALDKPLVEKIMRKQDVINYILENGKNEVVNCLRRYR